MSTLEPSPRLRATPRLRRRPATGLARAAVLGVLERLEGGTLDLTLPDGTRRRFGDGDGPWAAARIDSESFFRRAVTRTRTGVCEGYVAGEWDAEGDLADVFAVLVRAAERASSRWRAVRRLRELRPHLPARNGVRRARRHIGYHYDLGNELYALFLDESMTYSCAYFERPGQSLADAQQAKYRRLCEKLDIGPSDHVLEIGCGWGGFAVHAAAERGARVTGVTISREQAAFARRRVAELGLGEQVEILERDYRLLEGRFTKIVSIEMFEAIGEREFGTFFRTCDALLAPGGAIGLQVICIPDQRWERYRRTTDWVREYVFPGSLIPSLGAVHGAMATASGLIVQGVEDIGVHYAETLGTWRERFTGRLADVRALGYDETFVRTWELYLASCEALFRTRALRDLQLVLSRPFEDALPRYPSPRASH